MSVATTSVRVVSIAKEREANHILQTKEKEYTKEKEKEKRKRVCVHKESTVYK